VLLIAGAGRGAPALALELGRDGLRYVLAAAFSFGVGAAVAAAVASGIAAPLLTIGIGTVIYGLLGLRLAPEQVRLLLGAVRPTSA
jgi:hypothetical protein